MRVGAAQKNDRLDRFSFDPVSESLGLPLAYDASQSRTLLAGINWDVSDWGDVGVTALQNSQTGAPYGDNPLGNLTPSSRIDTNALDVAAHLKLGSGWVTTASYAEGLTQLDQRAEPTVRTSVSYSIAIAKHGVFGDDAVGFSFSHPTPGILGNGFDMVGGGRRAAAGVCRQQQGARTDAGNRSAAWLCHQLHGWCIGASGQCVLPDELSGPDRRDVALGPQPRENQVLNRRIFSLALLLLAALAFAADAKVLAGALFLASVALCGAGARRRPALAGLKIA